MTIAGWVLEEPRSVLIEKIDHVDQGVPELDGR